MHLQFLEQIYVDCDTTHNNILELTDSGKSQRACQCSSVVDNIRYVTSARWCCFPSFRICSISNLKIALPILFSTHIWSQFIPLSIYTSIIQISLSTEWKPYLPNLFRGHNILHATCICRRLATTGRFISLFCFEVLIIRYPH